MKENKSPGKKKEQCGTGRTEKMPEVRVSVRRMVEFILREGDIDSRVPRGRDTDAMLMGSRVHRMIQASGGSGYSAEVSMHTDKIYDGFVLHVDGRADGVIDSNDGEPATIEEIKGMYLDVSLLEEPFPLHLAQAKCYAAMYADAMDLMAEESREDSPEEKAEAGEQDVSCEARSDAREDSQEEEAGEADGKPQPVIKVRMTYVNLDRTSEIQRFIFSYGVEEIIAWYDCLLDRYAVWARWQVEHRKSRDESMQDMEFPFPYRPGQKELAAAVYHSILKKEELFLMAPTGVGKTMSCLFPAVRALGTGLADRIFYMTAKNATLEAGRHALDILKERKLVIRAVRITAKEKICPQGVVECTPDACPFAKGHFDRVNEALFNLISRVDLMDREEILTQAETYRVCPFLLELDAAVFCDVILCDYNYCFDPTARLSHFFGTGTKSDSVFLIDEAHNLVERGRDMYSADLVKEDVLSARRLVKGHRKLEQALRKLNELMLAMRKEAEGQEWVVVKGMPGTDPATPALAGLFDKLTYAVLHAYEEMQNLYRESEDGELKEKLLDFYFELSSFMDRMEVLDETSVVYVESKEERNGKETRKLFVLHIFCVSPAGFLTECVDMGRSAIFFSATLLPVDYYKKLLTTRENPWAIYTPSPFPRQKRCLLIGGDVSTRYRTRGTDMYRRIARYLHVTAVSHRGNYIAFFPSYRMLRDVFRVYREEFDTQDVDWVVQSSSMGESDREIFLENFYEDPVRSLLAFAVMGGMFAEGIDLTGTRLVGAIIVGTGLPQVSPRQNILRDYFDRKGMDGWGYAYLYPGINKVEQAAGRVIRTSEDTGVILLLDDRFLDGSVRRLFPREWDGYEITSLEKVGDRLRSFWETIAGEDEHRVQ